VNAELDPARVHSLCSDDPVTESRMVALEAGREYRLRVVSCLKRAGTFLEFGCRPPGGQTAAGDTFLRAVETARTADAVVFFGGLNHQHDTEGSDRFDLRAPAPQDQLIEAIADVNPNLVVVLLGSGCVELPWLSRVPAVVQAWYPGQEGGHAIADVLTGVVNPSGRLPVSWPRRLADTPAARCGDYAAGAETYREGLLVGYRHYDTNAVAPMFPFGHGLSYTTFLWSDLRIDGLPDGQRFRVRCTVRNAGPRDGAEVVQCYVAPPVGTAQRAAKELKAFRKLFLRAGESAEAAVDLDRRSFAFWSPGRGWAVEPGRYRILLAASAGDVRLAGECVL
jgi:beta-glucosidase